MRALLALVVAAGCGPLATSAPDAEAPDGGDAPADGAADAPAEAPTDTPCAAGTGRCREREFQRCADGRWMVVERCDALCTGELGCIECYPEQPWCDGPNVRDCTALGRRGRIVQTCDELAGESCIGGTCSGPCAEAARARSYLGCEYWPTVTTNAALRAEVFHFAVAVSNPHDVAVRVAVERGGTEVAAATVAPRGLETLLLPWVEALRNPPERRTARVAGGAYRLTASLPVSAYQWNPVEYRGRAGDREVFSYTSDASLLLPSSALGELYRVMSWPAKGGLPGFFAVVAIADGTRVSVEPSGEIEASAGRGPFDLDRGDVLQVLAATPCDPAACSARHDLTGTRIVATRPVAVFAGHDCAEVPVGTLACDHLEEQMFPVAAWEKSFVAVHTEAPGPNVYRVLAHRDGTAVTFEPAVHPPVTLAAGRWMELTSERDFEIRASDAVAVSQLMVGARWGGGSAIEGDPAMALLVPAVQYREAYTFLAPPTYARNWVNVVAPAGATVTLDDRPLGGLAPLGASFQVARVPLAGGAHSIAASAPIGILSYGIGNTTSYMVPGGLDVEAVTIP